MVSTELEPTSGNPRLPPVVRVPSLPLFPIPIPTFGTGHSSIPQAQGHLMSQASEHCYIFLVQGTLSRVKMQMKLSDPWGGPPQACHFSHSLRLEIPFSSGWAHSSGDQSIKAVLLLSRSQRSIRSAQPLSKPNNKASPDSESSLWKRRHLGSSYLVYGRNWAPDASHRYQQ